MKGVGRIHQQAFAKLYDRKTPITAANLLNDRLVAFLEEKEVKLRCRRFSMPSAVPVRADE